jgi:hypothetical protein
MNDKYRSIQNGSNHNNTLTQGIASRRRVLWATGSRITGAIEGERNPGDGWFYRKPATPSF